MSTLLLAKSALLSAVQATGLLAAVTRDDWQALSTGGVLGVVQTFADTVEADKINGYGKHGYRQERHTLSVAVCVAIGDNAQGYATATTALETVTEALKDALRLAFRTDLTPNDGPRGWQILRTTPPGDLDTRTHRMQRIIIQADCEFQEV